MIFVDSRAGAYKPGTHNPVDTLVAHINQLGVKCYKDTLTYGDACFEGNGPKGRMLIGIERKSLHDMLHCIDDARFAGHQRPGMLSWYGKSFLILEGHWKPSPNNLILLEGWNDGTSWGFCRYRSQKTMYSKLRRYLYSIELAGVIITYTRDLRHTAIDICELYHYFQKDWYSHTSMSEVKKTALPLIGTGHAPLIRRWAAALEDIGVKKYAEVERLFKTPIKMAQADEQEWMRISGVGYKTARKIVRDIWGIK